MALDKRPDSTSYHPVLSSHPPGLPCFQSYAIVTSRLSSFLNPEHFQEKHFLCEEGECASLQFTNAFRTDIDLKAHLASTHKDSYKHKGKLKRDLQLDLDFGPANVREGLK